MSYDSRTLSSMSRSLSTGRKKSPLAPKRIGARVCFAGLCGFTPRPLANQRPSLKLSLPKGCETDKF